MTGKMKEGNYWQYKAFLHKKSDMTTATILIHSIYNILNITIILNLFYKKLYFKDYKKGG